MPSHVRRCRMAQQRYCECKAFAFAPKDHLTDLARPILRSYCPNSSKQSTDWLAGFGLYYFHATADLAKTVYDRPIAAVGDTRRRVHVGTLSRCEWPIY